MRLDKDSFFPLRYDVVDLSIIQPLTFVDNNRLPRPFSVALHSPVEFHLLHSLEHAFHFHFVANPADMIMSLANDRAFFAIGAFHCCFPQSRLFQHFQQRGLSRIV